MLGVGDATHLAAADRSDLEDANTDGLGYTVLLRESGRGGNNTLTAVLNRAAAPQASSAATWSRGGTRRKTSYLCDALLGVLPVELHLELLRAVFRQLRDPELRLVLVRPSLSFGPRAALVARSLLVVRVSCSLQQALQGSAFALEHLEGIDDIEWLHLLRPFSTAQTLHVSPKLAGPVALALEDITAETVAEVLPSLDLICIEGQPVSSMEKFVTARRVSGRPVTVVNTKMELNRRLNSYVGDAAHLAVADESCLDDDGLGYTVPLRKSGRGGDDTLTAAMAVFSNSAASPEPRNANLERGALVAQFALALRALELRHVLVRPSLSFGHALLRRREPRAIPARDAHFLLLVVALQGGAFALEHLGAFAHAPELLQLRLVRLRLQGERAARWRVGGPPNLGNYESDMRDSTRGRKLTLDTRACLSLGSASPAQAGVPTGPQSSRQTSSASPT
ncbi:hypothetical protein EDB85DRAFT_2159650 [Lactarius pseudohatsudake]|nr:hypothetical protein EDB85DRAFT_2159650 [Lactarius pseudohatsudake]